MPGQLLEFYGLREHPFGVSPNPRYLYLSTQHREALATLITAIENFVGFSALIADPGLGKTALLFEVLRRFKDQASIAIISNTQCRGLELLRQIVMGLQVQGGESEQDPIRLYHLLTAFASERQNTKPVVIIIDEAQNLENSALETLRLLSNFEAEDRKLLHIILAGQPALKEKLRSHSQLLQRITIIARLGRLSPQETEECIAFRLRTAGYTGPSLFSNEAMAMIKQASGGVPREINRICINALEAGFALGEKEIGINVIEQVLSDLDLSCQSPSHTSRGTAPFETGPRIREIERPPFEIPAEPERAETPTTDAWIVDPFIDLGLGDEVIESVLSGLDASAESRTKAPKLQTAHFEPKPHAEQEDFDSSDRPRISYAQAGVGSSEEEIRALLSGMDLSVGIPQRPKAPRSSDFGSNEVESKESSAPVEPPKAPPPSPDPRALRIVAPRKPSEVSPKGIDPNDFVETPPEPVVFRVRDPWNTDVPIDPWARSGAYVPPPSEVEKASEKATAESENEPRKKISPTWILLFVILAVGLILYLAIPFISK